MGFRHLNFAYFLSEGVYYKWSGTNAHIASKNSLNLISTKHMRKAFLSNAKAGIAKE